MTSMTIPKTESSRLLYSRLASSGDVESRFAMNLLLHNPMAIQQTKSLSTRIRLYKSITVVTSIAVMAWIGLRSYNNNDNNPATSLYHSPSEEPLSSDPHQWNDSQFQDWESFLINHSEDPTAGIALVFKSQTKKEAHAQKKLAKKEGKMKRKEIKQELSHNDTVDELLYLNNTRAVRLVRHDSYNAASHFFFYQQGWEAQINQAYCAIATSAAVLNSLRGKIELPQDPLYEPFPWATQMAIVTNDCVKTAVFDVESVKRAGLGIGLVPNLLDCFLLPQGYVAKAYPVDPDFSSQDQLKDIVINALMDENSRVVINYDRGGIGQGPMGHGHWSPIGAYSAEIDAFLIMDVAKYKYPPVWVPTEAIFGGVATLDLCSSMKQHDLPVDWSQDFATIGQELGCTPGYRGFVVIAPIDSSP
ncbi:phytochelatin synthase [Nitzschia inconspicua]|uniref:Phytochelatin synthase n=1 Tax=Nitzschia inconspicua TaxID=303405 RepID=A0A9K3PKU5_9STRA|nr:phytochelatin synthase [Nitzschia inconspicua]